MAAFASETFVAPCPVPTAETGYVRTTRNTVGGECLPVLKSCGSRKNLFSKCKKNPIALETQKLDLISPILLHVSRLRRNAVQPNYKDAVTLMVTKERKFTCKNRTSCMTYSCRFIYCGQFKKFNLLDLQGCVRERREVLYKMKNRRGARAKEVHPVATRTF